MNRNCGSPAAVWRITSSSTSATTAPVIPEELRERIFEPFVTTKKPGEGTGLGLSLITDILTRHGGSIHLDTEEGVFTEMRVILPLEPPQDTDRETPAEASLTRLFPPVLRPVPAFALLRLSMVVKGGYSTRKGKTYEILDVSSHAVAPSAREF